MITRVPLRGREGLGSHKLHYTGAELGPNTLQTQSQYLVYSEHVFKFRQFQPQCSYEKDCYETKRVQL